MKRKLTIALIFCVVLNSYSQNEVHEFIGKVLEFQNPVEGVHIYNLSKMTGTTTNKNGSFSIIVSEKDTIFISHIKYQNKKIVLSKEDLTDAIPNIIYLEEMTNYLETVAIKNHNLSGSLETDIKEVPESKNLNKLSFDIKRLALLPSYKEQKYSVVQPFIPKSFIHSVDPIYMTGGASATFGKFKDLEIRNQLKSKRDFPEKIISDLGKHYFINSLKIPEEEIYNFLTFCDSKNIIDLYYKNDLLAVLTILQDESIAYLKIRN